jgi:hypothetical protein
MEEERKRGHEKALHKDDKNYSTRDNVTDKI